MFLWRHRMSRPPIATIDRLFEIAPGRSPPAVKLYAPDATGGVGVTRTYLDTPRANEVLAGLKAGAIADVVCLRCHEMGLKRSTAGLADSEYLHRQSA